MLEIAWRASQLWHPIAFQENLNPAEKQTRCEDCEDWVDAPPAVCAASITDTS